MDNKLSLGINVSIILTLTILTGLLILPLKLLLHTNYEIQNKNESLILKDSQKEMIDFKTLQVCPGKYKFWIDSIFINNYDRNCTYSNIEQNLKVGTTKTQKMKTDETDNQNSTSANSSISGLKIIRPKSVPVTDYILVIMLTVSVIGAFVEFLKIRFTNTQDESSSVEGIASRRQSIMNLMLPRKCTRESLKTQMSLDVPGSNRSAVRVSVAFQGRVHRR
ncbi:uncharacterized protein [Chelonus insularis]|uniref:uncharacterized protein isoform X2 n=1 Tax=Chelonus insularis TaxID=460826 RepID=UPI001589A8BC|nr:uncharacterized protein LOC118074117 isoform X2 [Chelonus insularis]